MPTPLTTSSTTQVASSTETRTSTISTTVTVVSTSTTSTPTTTSLTATSTTLKDETEIWPVECGPPCRCKYWSSSARLRFGTIEKCQERAELRGHVFFTYNPSNRKCVTGNRCFYNTRTAHPSRHWYQNSLQWRAHKSSRSQG